MADEADEQVVYRSDRTLVTRRTSSAWGCPVVVLARTGAAGRQRLVHEATILRSLSGLAGVPRLLSEPDDLALVVRDVGGVALAQLIQAAEDGAGTPWRAPELIDLAVALAEVLVEVHQRGVVHLDITPANILVHGPDRRPLLIDFELARTLTDECSLVGDAGAIQGTLAYLAPEQTGRTGRAVDQRTDLYALGATLHELATGHPPFGRGEDGAVALIHRHLAQQPSPLSALRSDLPAAFSQVVVRLLEKDPDRRYQSAEGLLHDLRLICDHLRTARNGDGPGSTVPEPAMRLGTRDFPLRFRAPDSPVAREHELRVQAGAFGDALAGDTRALFVVGPAGVGKTTLVEELRPVAADAGGWFVTTTFAPDGDGQGLDAGVQALGAVGRLLLAEPEAQLREHRQRLLETLGVKAGLLAGMVPEFALLLDVPPQPATGDPLRAQSAAVQVAVAVLRAVAREGRPLILVLDGLQWAPPFPLDLLDALITAEPSPGLLVVGTYRDDEVADSHPLAALVARWHRFGVTPHRIRLDDLSAGALATMLAEVLRLEVDEATRLAELVHTHTGGNPCATIDLLNAMRRDGTLAPGRHGWTWDPAVIQRYVAGSARADLLAARVAALPDRPRRVLEMLACLGGEVDLPLLSAATGVAAGELAADLAPSLADGLLVTAAAGDLASGDGLRLRHDRLRQAALDRLGPSARGVLHLEVARRLAGRPDYRPVAAEQYLAALDDVDDPAEGRRVAELFAAVARDLRVTNPAAAERYLAAALRVLPSVDPGGRPPTGDVLGQSLEVARHAVLYSLGRFDEADELYRCLQTRAVTGFELFAAGAVQIASLTNRARPREAVSLGLHLLQQVGLQVPPAGEVAEVVAARLTELYEWVGDGAAEDLRRPDIADPRIRATAEIISVLMAPAFFSDQDVMAWLVLESRRLWAEHGPCRALVAPLCHAAVVAIGLRQDFEVGYRVVRRVLDLSVERGYEPETSRARFLFAVSAGHWFEPLENVLSEGRQARDGLLNGGDSQGAVFTYHALTATQLDTAASLDEYQSIVDGCLSLAERTGNDQTADAVLPYRHLVTVLRGGTTADAPAAPAGAGVPAANDGPTDDPDAAPMTNPMAVAIGHVAQALEALILDDRDALARHSRAAMRLLPFLCSHYTMARVHLLRALAAADQLRSGGAPGRPAGESGQEPLAVLDVCRAWMADRAEQSASGYAHLLSLIDAERAWGIGDVSAARLAFDRGLEQVGRIHRPWHRAYLLERAGTFAIEQGEQHFGGVLLGLSRRAYAGWGAQAKVQQLERTHPFLRAAGNAVAGAGARSSTTALSAEALDLLSVLKASQALSRETELDQLRDRVVGVLTAMTGATSVTILLRSEDGQRWIPSTSLRESVQDASVEDLSTSFPLSAIRYVARTSEPVVVSDTTTDHRFASDPYLAAGGRGSLLVVPIQSRGQSRVMLVLENRLQCSVFSADRLDAVLLIAGQLAVSFDIALAREELQRESDRRLQLLGTLQSRERLLETLLSIQRDISHRAPLQTVLDSVTAGASSLLDGAYVALVLAQQASSPLPAIPSVSGTSVGPEQEALVLSLAAESIAADSMVSHHAVHPDSDDGDRGSADGDPASLIAAPVHVNGEIIGSLVTRVCEGGTTLAERRDLLAAFAEQVSLALNDASTLQAIRAASLDFLTGLATRKLFMERLTSALARHLPVSVLFIDLDRFKQVNDSLGHDAGDQLLADVAERIRRTIRDSDTAARFGGDEFAVLLEDNQESSAGLRVGEALTAALAHPFRIAGKEIFASASIGVAASSQAGETATALLKQADLAMYRAKRERSRRPVLFENQMHEDVSRRLELAGDLESAVKGGQLWLQYQPQVLMGSADVVAVEALVRWTHPDRGPISPAEFIPIAEDTGVIVDLGRWVLRTACHQIVQWRREHPALKLSVNVSGRQLTDGHLAGDLESILVETGLEPGALTLELTESVLMDDPVQSLTRLQELKRIGVLLALDDFGTGYSSLAYLHRFPVDELKIDKSFVDKIGSSEADLAIVRVVVELARILHLTTTAEGVETPEQAELLTSVGCTLGQGYLFARPLTKDDIPEFLARRPPPAPIPGQRAPGQGGDRVPGLTG